MSDEAHNMRMGAGQGVMALMDALDDEGLDLLRQARTSLVAFADRLEAAGAPRLAATGGIVSFIVGALIDRPEAT